MLLCHCLNELVNVRVVKRYVTDMCDTLYQGVFLYLSNLYTVRVMAVQQ